MGILHASDPKIDDLLEALNLRGKYVTALQLTVQVGGVAEVSVEYEHYVTDLMGYVRDVIERRSFKIDDTSKLTTFFKRYELHEIP